jgi:hypothetical protein
MKEFPSRSAASAAFAKSDVCRTIDRSYRLCAEPAPRLLSARQAAHYLGYRSTDILKRIPIVPVRIGTLGAVSGPRYDRKKLDAWLDQLSDLNLHNEDDPAHEADEA